MLICIIQQSSSLISDKVYITLSLSLNHAQASLYLFQIHIQFSQKIQLYITLFIFFCFFAEYISPYSFTPLETHLCNPTSSPISANPSGSSLNQFNSINPAKTLDGYLFSHHFDQNFNSFNSKIGFCKVSSFGY